MSFLNAVLKVSDMERIKEINFMNVSMTELRNRTTNNDIKIEAKC